MLACLWTVLEAKKHNKFIVESSGRLHGVEMEEATNVFEELIICSFWAEGEVVGSAEASVIFTTMLYPKDYNEQVVWP
jgi:hypothetical protein